MTVVRFPLERCIRAVRDPEWHPLPPEPAVIIILPVVRIERDHDAAPTCRPLWGGE